MRSLVLVTVAVLTGAPALGQSSAAVAEAVSRQNGGEGARAAAVSVRTDTPVRLDGRLEEEAWEAAPLVTEFIQREPDEGSPGSERTEVRFVYDDEALYIGARMQDGGGVTRRLGRRDMALAGSDWLRVSLDSYRDRLTAFHFDVNPSGVRRDAYLSAAGTALSWDAVWDAATSVDAEGWTAEIRIPFSQLRFSRADEQPWGVQIERVVDRTQERAVFAFAPKSAAGGIAAFGDLVGLRGIAGSGSLEMVPYVLAKSEFVEPGANPYRSAEEYGAAMGLDARLRVASNLTLTASLNPDFGQVEVDPGVINLTAFETFYEEKRPFFVEGANSFRFGDSPPGPWPITNLFYSRRIGRAPQLGAPVREADVPAVTSLFGAAKLTGRTAAGWSIGVLNAVTQAEYSRYREGGVDRTALAEPLTNYFAARANRELRGGQSTLGGILTSVARSLPDARAEGALRSSAHVGGIDFSHEWDERSWALSGSLTGSRIDGSEEAIAAAQRSFVRYFARPDADHLELDPAATSLSGYSGQVRLRKQAGEHLRADVAASAVSPGFEANDLGFQSRADRMGVNGSLRWAENRPRGVLRSWSLQGMGNFARNYGGDWIDRWVDASVHLQDLSYRSLIVGSGYYPERADDRLTRGGPLALGPRRWTLGFLASSDPRSPLSGSLRGRMERSAAGARETQLQASASLRPSPRWSLSAGPQFVREEMPAQYLGRVADPTAGHTFGSRYVFAPLSYSEVSLETRLNVSFSPDLTLELFAQPLLSSGTFGAPREFASPGGFEFREYAELERLAEGGFRIDPDGSGPAGGFRLRDPDFTSHALRGNAVLRWEWRAGSTLYLVWQQGREYEGGSEGFRGGRAVESLLGTAPDNVFVLKWTYWLNPRL